jgi:hypothetical protein
MASRIAFVMAVLLVSGCRLDRGGLSGGGGDTAGTGGGGGIDVTTSGGGGAGGAVTTADASTGGRSGSGGGSGGRGGDGEGGRGGSGGVRIEAGVPDTAVADAGGSDAETPDAGSRTCMGIGECGVGFFCERAAGACAGPGVCVAIPATCPTTSALVCGCDGHTYFNDCFRRQVRVSKDSNGRC